MAEHLIEGPPNKRPKLNDAIGNCSTDSSGKPSHSFAIAFHSIILFDSLTIEPSGHCCQAVKCLTVGSIPNLFVAYIKLTSLFPPLFQT